MSTVPRAGSTAAVTTYNVVTVTTIIPADYITTTRIQSMGVVGAGDAATRPSEPPPPAGLSTAVSGPIQARPPPSASETRPTMPTRDMTVTRRSEVPLRCLLWAAPSCAEMRSTPRSRRLSRGYRPRRSSPTSGVRTVCRADFVLFARFVFFSPASFFHQS